MRVASLPRCQPHAGLHVELEPRKEYPLSVLVKRRGECQATDSISQFRVDSPIELVGVPIESVADIDVVINLDSAISAPTAKRVVACVPGFALVPLLRRNIEFQCPI